MWKSVNDKPVSKRNVIAILKDGRCVVARYGDMKNSFGRELWSWADGFPVGVNMDGDTMFSSWCEISEKEIEWWTYPPHEGKNYHHVSKREPTGTLAELLKELEAEQRGHKEDKK